MRTEGGQHRRLNRRSACSRSICFRSKCKLPRLPSACSRSSTSSNQTSPSSWMSVSICPTGPKTMPASSTTTQSSSAKSWLRASSSCAMPSRISATKPSAKAPATSNGWRPSASRPNFCSSAANRPSPWPSSSACSPAGNSRWSMVCRTASVDCRVPWTVSMRSIPACASVRLRPRLCCWSLRAPAMKPTAVPPATRTPWRASARTLRLPRNCRLPARLAPPWIAWLGRIANARVAVWLLSPLPEGSPQGYHGPETQRTAPGRFFRIKSSHTYKTFYEK